MIEPDKLWTIPELAKHASVSKDRIYQLIYNQKLKAVNLRPDGVRYAYRILHSDWMSYIESLKVQKQSLSKV